MIRILHWTTAVLFVADALVFDEGTIHNVIGYTLFVTVLIRLIWGFSGDKYARFGASWPS